MNGLLQDLRYALRQLRKSPGFTTTAILLLAMGIGANTAIFQLLAAVRLRSLPVQAPRNVVGIVLRQALTLLAFGIAVGLLVALATTRGASSLFFGLQPNDPLACAGASVLLIVIALLASFLSAPRASRVDPVVALRYE